MRQITLLRKIDNFNHRCNQQEVLTEESMYSLFITNFRGPISQDNKSNTYLFQSDTFTILSDRFNNRCNQPGGLTEESVYVFLSDHQFLRKLSQDNIFIRYLFLSDTVTTILK